MTETIHFAGELFRRVSTVGSSFGVIEDQYRLYIGDREVAEITRSSTGSSSTVYFHQDHQGSVDVVSKDDGTSYEQRYDVFGAPQASGLALRSGYTGHQHDRDLGFIDMRGRLYDPLASRFVSADPITQEPDWSQGLNRYAYVFNDPVNRTDPSGFFVGGLVGAIVGAGHLASGVAIAAGFGASIGAIANAGASLGLGGAGSLMPGGPSFTGTPGSGPQAVSTPVQGGAPLAGPVGPGEMAQAGPGCLMNPAACVEGFVDTFNKHKNKILLGAGAGAALMFGSAVGAAIVGSEVAATIAAAEAGKAAVRREAQSLAEKLALEEAKAGAGKRIMAEKIKDAMYPKELWAKMSHVHKLPGGGKIEIHYWENLKTGLRVQV